MRLTEGGNNVSQKISIQSSFFFISQGNKYSQTSLIEKPTATVEYLYYGGQVFV